jgi:hypothetical protein
MKRVGNIAMGLTHLLNATVFGGSPVESLSGRVYREDRKWAVRVIDTIFFFQPNHCLHAHVEDRLLAKALLGLIDSE